MKEEKDLEAEKRRRRVEEMILHGVSNRSQMAAAFGVSPDTIENDIIFIRANWLEQNKATAQENAAKRILQLEHIAHLALLSFERSRQDKTERTIVEKACDNPLCKEGIIMDNISGKNSECPRCLGTCKVSVETVKVSGQAGDSSFLNAAKACVSECARIEGVYPNHTNILQKFTKTETKIHESEDGQKIVQTIQELYVQAPDDEVVNALAMLERLRESAKTKVLESSAEAKPSVPKSTSGE